MPLLGVNIDHVATLRQQRREQEPSPLEAALLCEQAGADSIVAHLREDRRHIQDRDIIELRKALRVRFNMEMSIASDIVALALKVSPDQVTLVPERRQELTTEGGLNVLRQKIKLRNICRRLQDKKIDVSLFIAPDKDQIEATAQIGVKTIELHTGCYAELDGKSAQKQELKRLTTMTMYAKSLGMIVNAGHGLKYHNTHPIAAIPGIHELNIGHSIISRAVFTGLSQAVREMRRICKEAK